MSEDRIDLTGDSKSLIAALTKASKAWVDYGSLLSATVKKGADFDRAGDRTKIVLETIDTAGKRVQVTFVQTAKGLQLLGSKTSDASKELKVLADRQQTTNKLTAEAIALITRETSLRASQSREVAGTIEAIKNAAAAQREAGETALKSATARIRAEQVVAQATRKFYLDSLQVGVKANVEQVDAAIKAGASKVRAEQVVAQATRKFYLDSLQAGVKANVERVNDALKSAAARVRAEQTVADANKKFALEAAEAIRKAEASKTEAVISAVKQRLAARREEISTELKSASVRAGQKVAGTLAVTPDTIAATQRINAAVAAEKAKATADDEKRRQEAITKNQARLDAQLEAEKRHQAERISGVLARLREAVAARKAAIDQEIKDFAAGERAKAVIAAANHRFQLADMRSRAAVFYAKERDSAANPARGAQLPVGTEFIKKSSGGNLSFDKMLADGKQLPGTINQAAAAAKKLAGETERAGKASGHALLTWRGLARLLIVQQLHQAIRAITQAIQESIDVAIKFKVAIAEIQTIDRQEMPFDSWAQGLRELSDAWGFNILDQAEAAYQTLSNQVAEGVEIFTFLASANTLAKSTLSSTTQAADLLSSAINAYGLQASDAGQLSDQFFKIVELGRVRVEEMSSTIGRIAAPAAQVGVPMEELGAAIALTTSRGVKFSEATTFIRNVLQKFLRPTEAMNDLLRQNGYESGEAALRALGLGGAMGFLEEKVEGSATEMGELFGRIRAIAGASVFAGKGLEDYNRFLEEIKNSSGAASEASKLVQENAGRKLQVELNKTKNVFTQDFGAPIVDWLSLMNDRMGGFSNVLNDVARSPVVAELTRDFEILAEATIGAAVALGYVFEALEKLAVFDGIENAALIGKEATQQAKEFKRFVDQTAELEAERVKTTIDSAKKRADIENEFIKQRLVGIADLRRANESLIDQSIRASNQLQTEIDVLDGKASKALDTYVKNLGDASKASQELAKFLKEVADIRFNDKLDLIGDDPVKKIQAVNAKIDELVKKRDELAKSGPSTELDDVLAQLRQLGEQRRKYQQEIIKDNQDAAKKRAELSKKEVQIEKDTQKEIAELRKEKSAQVRRGDVAGAIATGKAIRAAEAKLQADKSDIRRQKLETVIPEESGLAAFAKFEKERAAIRLNANLDQSQKTAQLAKVQVAEDIQLRKTAQTELARLEKDRAAKTAAGDAVGAAETQKRIAVIQKQIADGPKGLQRFKTGLGVGDNNEALAQLRKFEEERAKIKASGKSDKEKQQALADIDIAENELLKTSGKQFTDQVSFNKLLNDELAIRQKITAEAKKASEEKARIEANKEVIDDLKKRLEDLSEKDVGDNEIDFAKRQKLLQDLATVQGKQGPLGAQQAGLTQRKAAEERERFEAKLEQARLKKVSEATQRQTQATEAKRQAEDDVEGAKSIERQQKAVAREFVRSKRISNIDIASKAGNVITGEGTDEATAKLRKTAAEAERVGSAFLDGNATAEEFAAALKKAKEAVVDFKELPAIQKSLSDASEAQIRAYEESVTRLQTVLQTPGNKPIGEVIKEALGRVTVADADVAKAQAEVNAAVLNTPPGARPLAPIDPTISKEAEAKAGEQLKLATSAAEEAKFDIELRQKQLADAQANGAIDTELATRKAALAEALTAGATAAKRLEEADKELARIKAAQIAPIGGDTSRTQLGALLTVNDPRAANVQAQRQLDADTARKNALLQGDVRGAQEQELSLQRDKLLAAGVAKSQAEKAIADAAIAASKAKTPEEKAAAERSKASGIFGKDAADKAETNALIDIETRREQTELALAENEKRKVLVNQFDLAIAGMKALGFGAVGNVASAYNNAARATTTAGAVDQRINNNVSVIVNNDKNPTATAEAIRRQQARNARRTGA